MFCRLSSIQASRATLLSLLPFCYVYAHVIITPNRAKADNRVKNTNQETESKQ